MSHDHTQSKELRIFVKESLTPLLGAKAIEHMGLIEVHEENFEKIAAAKIGSTKHKQLKRSLMNTVMFLKAIWGHWKEYSISTLNPLIV